MTKNKGKLLNLTFNEYVKSSGNKDADDKISEILLNGDYNNYAVDLGSLPEVIIMPDKESKQTLYNLRKMFRTKDAIFSFQHSPIFQDKYRTNNTNYKTNKNISDNEKIDRLYNIYKMSGYPSITSQKSIINYIPFVGETRPNYNPITNTIHLPTNYNEITKKRNKNYNNIMERKGLLNSNNKKSLSSTRINSFGIIPELSHAFNTYSKYTSNYSKFGLPSDIKINGKNSYNRNGTFEYDAHNITEPNINHYIHGNIDLNTFINNIKNRRISLEQYTPVEGR